MKFKVLFVCATNGLHSPMAESLLCWLDAENFDATSAGAVCGRLHPLAAEVMKEVGIDLDGKTLRSINEVPNEEFDYVITLGERVPNYDRTFRRAETVHWTFENPAATSNDPQVRLREFRMVRDQILLRLRLFVLVHTRTRHTSGHALSVA